MTRGDDKPGKGLLGWLGRQVGYVTKAVKTDPAVVAKREHVEEKTDANHPGVVFRRTIRDEVRRDVGRNDESRPERGTPIE